ARINAAASPKLDDRVLVYPAEAISATVLEHAVEHREVVLDVGARDGVRFGHAFQIMGEDREGSIAVAKVIELEAERCVARVVSPHQRRPRASVQGFSAVCAAPKAAGQGLVVECVFGKDVWRTESLENKLIRGMLESGGKRV